MNTTQTHKAPYTINQLVEVSVVDFATPGMPRVWRRAEVIAIEACGKLFDLTVRFEDPALPVKRVLVGPRAGGKQVRAL